MRRLLHLFHRRTDGRQLANQMREHIREITEELIAEGVPPEKARAEARRRFGNATSIEERTRDEWSFPRIENLLADLRYALRSLRKSPHFAAIVILPLALGIGANTAIFTVVEAALLRSLPYRAPERLVHLYEVELKNEPQPHEASYPDFVEWSTATQSFEAVSGYSQGGSMTLGSDAAQSEQINIASADAKFFSLLGVQPALGRTFLPAESQPGANRVAILSDSLWRRRFHADTGIVGRTVTINLRPVQVIGVLPPMFQFAPAGAPDVWLAVSPSATQRQRGYTHWLQVVARLRPGVTLPQAHAELTPIAQRISKNDPEHHAKATITALPLREVIVGEVRPVLLVLLGTIGLVLLIACANVANLLLARSAARQRELAVRASLGAGRARLVQQLLTESVLMAVIGGALGIVVARFGVTALIGAIPRPVLDTLPFFHGLSLHPGMLAFTLAISLITGVLFGLAPALRLSRGGFEEALKSGRGTSSGAAHHRLRRVLLVAEVAISLMLLAAAGLMMKSTVRLLAVNPGFATDHLMTAQLAVPGVRYPRSPELVGFYERLLESLESSPGVRGAATVSVLPLSGGSNTGTMRIESLGAASPVYTVSVRTISSHYSQTLGIPLLAGRLFDERDRPGATRVVLLNRKLAAEAFPGQSPLGRLISFPWSGGPLEVAGVVGDENTVTLDRPIRPAVYFPLLQGPDHFEYIVVRTAGNPASIASTLRARVRALDPQVSLYDVQSMDEMIADSPAAFQRRYPAFLIGIFAAIALVMAASGTYGMVAYAVAQRRQEIGIRIALGAQRSDVFRLVVGQGMALAAAGVVIGLAGAAIVTRALSKLLFDVTPTDPATFATVAAVLLGAAFVASAIPAIRAARVAPASVLGSE
jgi:predicted permease